MEGRRSLSTWYALVVCVWSIPTLLILLLCIVIGPIGPSSTHVATPWLTRYWTLLVWVAIPIVCAPFGLRR